MNNKYRIDIDETNAVRIYNDEVPDSPPFIYQPDRPEATPWADRAEAQAWADKFVEELIANEAKLAAKQTE